NAKDAADHIASHVHDLDTSAPDAVKIVTGDLNYCSLKKVLPGYHQQVTCTTRGDRTLDHPRTGGRIVAPATVKIYSNNKPWVTKHIKEIINKMKKAFGENNKEQLKDIQKELKVEIRKGKKEYKRKIEQKFQTNDIRKVWEGMNLMGGRKTTKRSQVNSDSANYANDLNRFYARFDCHDFGREREDMKGDTSG
ncbi:hypothetical protein BaRGS_00038910, partial [Batillaria attramentaria]